MYSCLSSAGITFSCAWVLAVPAAEFSPSNNTAISSRVGPLVSTKKKKITRHSMTNLNPTKLVSLQATHEMGWGLSNNLHHDIHQVEAPLQPLNSKRIHPLVKYTAQRRKAKAKRETLCADVERQDFDGVRDRQAGPRSTSGAVEAEYHSHDGDTRRRGLCLGVYGAARRPDRESDEHSNACEQE